MIDGKKILWCWNVYDRPVDLRMNFGLIRRGLGNDVDVGVFCNCPDERVPEFKGNGEQIFVWKKNSGHHLGTLDSYVGFRDMLLTDDFKNHDYIVVAHAKSWWGDYSLFRDVMSMMISSDRVMSHIHLKPHGSLNDPRYMGLWLDFVVFARDLYIESIDKLSYDREMWSEVLMYRCTQNIQMHKRLIIEQCDVPVTVRSDVPPCDKLFDNFITHGHFILAHYSIAKKLKLLRDRYPATANELRHLLPADVETWDWNRRS